MLTNQELDFDKRILKTKHKFYQDNLNNLTRETFQENHNIDKNS